MALKRDHIHTDGVNAAPSSSDPCYQRDKRQHPPDGRDTVRAGLQCQLGGGVQGAGHDASYNAERQ